MKRGYVEINYSFILLLLLFLMLSCSNERPVEELYVEKAIDITHGETDLYYFDGNYVFTLDSSSFIESSTGKVISVYMTGLPYIMETEFAKTYRTYGKSVYVETMGRLIKGNNDIIQLDIKDFLNFDTKEAEPEILVGEYTSEEGKILDIRSDHTFAMKDRRGRVESTGTWFYTSKILISFNYGDSEVILKSNAKKKSLNTLDDIPSIFSFSGPSR